MRTADRKLRRLLIASGIGWHVVATTRGASAQVAERPVRGVVRDSTAGQPIAGVLVDLTGPTLQRRSRADQSGEFYIGPVPTGRYTISLRLPGFKSLMRELEITERDTVFAFALAPVSRQLDTVRVGVHVPSIFGIIAESEALGPIAGATVQVVGGGRTVTTDSLGRFDVPLQKGGSFLVRVSRAGYEGQLLTINVPPDRVTNFSVLLDSTSARSPHTSEMAWADFDARLRWRAMNSALLSGTELRRAGSTVEDAVSASPSFQKHGLHLGPSTCVFVNGMPRPGLPLNGIRIEEVEAIELYGARGDPTSSLARRWPPGAPCGESSSAAARGRRVAESGVAMFAAIWLRP